MTSATPESPTSALGSTIAPLATANLNMLFGAFGFCCMVLIVATIVTVIWTRRDGWATFAEDRKLASRICLCVLCLFIGIPMVLASEIAYGIVPGKIQMESPLLTSTAIKIGLYGLYVQNQLETELPAEQRNLPACIKAISDARALSYVNKCSDGTECFLHIPPMSRSDIIDAIKTQQTNGNADPSSTACRDIDVSKL